MVDILIDQGHVHLPTLDVRAREQLIDRTASTIIEVRLHTADGSFDRAITYTVTSNLEWTKKKLANGVARLWKEWAQS